jgi:PAS domain S-box-containing protein
MAEGIVEQALQEQLEAMELRVKGILGAIPAGIVFVDLNGRVEAVTEHFEALSGYDTKDICNRNISKFIQSERTEAELAKRLIEACSEGLMSAQALKKNGDIISVKLTVSMIDTAEGVGMMLCVLDATKENVL